MTLEEVDELELRTRADVSKLADELRRLIKFKAYVHGRLNEAGIPADPESPHQAEGCRIGGRLDVVFALIKGRH